MQSEAVEKQKEKDEKLSERKKEMNSKYMGLLELESEKFKLRFSDFDRKRTIQKTLEEHEKERIMLKHNFLKEKVERLHSERE